MYYPNERLKKRVDGQEDQDTQRVSNGDSENYPIGYFCYRKIIRIGALSWQKLLRSTPHDFDPEYVPVHLLSK